MLQKSVYIPTIYLSLVTISESISEPLNPELSEPILPNPSVFESPPNNLARGRQYYDELKTKVKYSECWAEALTILHSGCSKMCDEEQRRIAYQFTFCHMKASGRNLPEICPLEKPIKECTENLPDLTFNVYNEFIY